MRKFTFRSFLLSKGVKASLVMIARHADKAEVGEALPYQYESVDSHFYGLIMKLHSKKNRRKPPGIFHIIP